MDNNKNNFDEFLRNSIDDYGREPSGLVWKNVSGTLLVGNILQFMLRYGWILFIAISAGIVGFMVLPDKEKKNEHLLLGAKIDYSNTHSEIPVLNLLELEGPTELNAEKRSSLQQNTEFNSDSEIKETVHITKSDNIDPGPEYSNSTALYKVTDKSDHSIENYPGIIRLSQSGSSQPQVKLNNRTIKHIFLNSFNVSHVQFRHDAETGFSREVILRKIISKGIGSDWN